MTGDLLNDHRALVTGAARGIGRAIALALAAHGADVAVVDRRAPELTDVVDRIRALGRRCIPIAVDLTADRSSELAVTRAIEGLGGLEIVVNNAGMGRPVAIDHIAPALWRETFRINVEAAANVCAAAATHLRPRHYGSIINIASAAAFQALPHSAPYAASKSALVSLTRTLAIAWAPDSIRVNALCPGWTRTTMTTPLRASEATTEAVLSRVPLHRWAEPVEIADAAVLLSVPTTMITGAAVSIDGGIQAA
ncbi:SDR family NAD(P)-dependent oxidoreductase [Streptomyces sp. NPDC055239]